MAITSATDQAIMDSLHDYEEDGDTSVSQNSEQTAVAASEGQSASTEVSTPSKVESASQQTAQPESTSVTTQQTAQVTQQEAPKTVGPRRTVLKFDKDNNVVDDNGAILAKAGKERRMYESWVNARDSAAVLLEQNKQLQQQIQHTQYVHGLPEKYKLSLGETESAIQLMQAFKTDPAKTLRDLITQAQASGITLDEVSTQPLDINAVRAMIRAELGQGQQPQRSAPSHTMDEGTTQAAQFFAQFPDAHVQETEIARLMGVENCSPTEAYWKLKAYAIENGLDWSQPLIPQYQMRQQQQQSHVQTQQPVQQVSTASHVPRVQTTARASQTVDNSQQQHAAATDSWADIIRGAMNDAYS